jgi:DNA replication initiation complex subunit (GINS family)
LPDTNYDLIKNAWIAEQNNDALQDLEDLKLNKMTEYLSQVRLKLAETNAEDRMQFNLYTQEALNLEFMIHDMLILRRDKILKACIRQIPPKGTMTVFEEEDFYKKLVRGFENHNKYVDDVLAGTPLSTMKVNHEKSTTKKEKEDKTELTELEYVLVSFLKPVDNAFVGLDEVTYGPYEVGDTATIPLANARRWLRDGIVTRIIMEREDSE